jgi:flagellar hook-associated protein 3 FlgL
MRLSTNTIYQNNTSRLSTIQSQLDKLNLQVSTMKKINTPADDPVASARIMELNTSKNMNTTYANNRKVAETQLETYEANLSSVTDTIQDVQASLVSAGNGSYSDEERSNLANALQSNLNTLMSLANTKDSQGNYLYSGYATSTVPFASNGDYQGNTSRTNLQVDVQSQMAVSYTGDKVFGGSGNNVFTTLQNVISLLKTPITDSTTQDAFNTGLATAIDNMKGSLTNVLDARSEIGSNLNLVDTLNTTGDNLDLQYDSSLSDLQDLDYAQALSDISKNNTVLEAAQKAFVATSKLSLFSLI